MLSLTKANLLQLDPISQKHTLRLLPLGKNNRQKVVVGDDSGTLYSYDFNKGEPIPVFSTKVFDGPISCVALGGASAVRPDKIFVAHRQQLSGISKKGKEFFTLSSSLSENITTIAVENTMIWTGCESICNQYESGKDVAFFMSRGEINCMAVDYIAHRDVFDCILGCEDNAIRFMQGDDLTMEILTPSPVTAIACMRRMNEGNTETPPMVLYAREGGDIVCLEFTTNQLDSQGRRKKAEEGQLGDEYRECWSLSDNEANKSSISCIKAFDLTGDGRQELLVAREDGRVEVYAQSEDGDDTGAFGLHRNRPRLVFSYDIGEKVQSLEAGKVNNTACSEIVVASYSGKVISFTTEELDRDAPENLLMGASNMLGNSNAPSRPIAEVNNDNRIKSLHKEIEGLLDKIEKTKGKVKKLESDAPGGMSLPSFSSSSASSAADSASKSGALHTADFSSATKFALDRDLGVYILNVEIQCPLDVVIIRSPVKLEVVEVDMTTSLVSVTPEHLLDPLAEDDADPCRFIAAMRARTGEKRTKLAVRPKEGDYGDIHVTIVTATAPKMAKSLRFPLKPLSLHAVSHVMTDGERDRPRCSITFKGDFSVNVAFEWLQSALPDVAFNLGEGASTEVVHFKNCHSQAVAKCRMERNTIVFESQSPSTVAVFKEAITRQATFRRTALNEATEASPEAVRGFLWLFRENLAYQQSLAKKVAVVDAVKEVTHAEGGSEGSAPAWLAGDLHAVYRDSERIRKEFKEKGRVLDSIADVITGAHVDYHRLQGLLSRSNPAAVRAAVMSGGDWEALAALVVGDSNGGDKSKSTPGRRASSRWQPDHGEEDHLAMEGD